MATQISEIPPSMLLISHNACLGSHGSAGAWVQPRQAISPSRESCHSKASPISSKACFIVYFTLNKTLIYKMNIMLTLKKILETSNQDRKCWYRLDKSSKALGLLLNLCIVKPAWFLASPYKDSNFKLLNGFFWWFAVPTPEGNRLKEKKKNKRVLSDLSLC